MANVFGTVASGVIAARALQLAFNSFLPSVFATDLQQIEPNLPHAAKGETITVKILTPPTVEDFPGTAQDIGTTSLTLTLDQMRSVTHQYTHADIESVNTMGSSVAAKLHVEERAVQMARVLGEDFIAKLLAVFTTANGYDSMSAMAAADMDYDYFVDAGKELDLDSRRCPKAGRFALVNNTVFANLLKDERVNKMHKEVAGADPVDTAILHNVAGFTVRQVPQLNTANTTTKLAAIFGSGDSALYASRLPRNPAEILPNAPANALIEEIVDPGTGMRMIRQEQRDDYNLTAKIRDVILFGVAKGFVKHAVLGITT